MRSASSCPPESAAAVPQRGRTRSALGRSEETSVSKQDDIFRASDIVRASEVSQYAYCARSWWLARKQAYRSSNVAELLGGTADHHQHGRLVLRYRRMRQLALAFLLLAAVALIVSILASVRI